MPLQPITGRLSPERIKAAYDEGFWHGELLFEHVARHAGARPEALAVVDGGRRVTWSELDQLCRRLALHLVERGIAPNDSVVLQLPNWLEYVISYHAIQMVGAVVVQPGVDWRDGEVENALRVGPAKALIIPCSFADHDFQAMAARLRDDHPSLKHVFAVRGPANEGHVSLDDLLRDPIEERTSADTLSTRRPSPDQVIRVVFTSGTTGVPKPIMHTNNSTTHSARTLMTAFQVDETNVLFSYVPLSTNYGAIMGLYLHATSGATTVYMDQFSATRALQLVGQEGITFIPGTPTAFMALTSSRELARANTDSLRMVISAGAAFPKQAIQDLRQKIDAVVIESYGMNEFGMGFWCSLNDNPDVVLGSMGKPIPGLEARVVNSNGDDVPHGDTGELVIKSAGMCCGYEGRPEANEESWDNNGWFHSGDLARIDAQGNFHIAGRSKDVIIRGGANVSPREVEEVIITLPSIRDVSVIGLPDDYYGETVCACVIMENDATIALDDLRHFLGPRLAAYKIPTTAINVEAFPLNAMGKVIKADLLSEALERLDAD